MGLVHGEHVLHCVDCAIGTLATHGVQRKTCTVPSNEITHGLQRVQDFGGGGSEGGGKIAGTPGRSYTATSQLQTQRPDPRIVFRLHTREMRRSEDTTGVDKLYGDRTPEETQAVVLITASVSAPLERGFLANNKARMKRVNSRERGAFGKRSDGTGACALLLCACGLYDIAGRSRAPSNTRKTKTKKHRRFS